jgi:glycosyltransferase involved in cell wall biosynthesis
MRILYVTANSFLRSTSTILNLVIRDLRPRGLQPVLLFQEEGPWQRELAAEGIPCYFDPLRIPDKYRPLRSASDIGRLVRLVRRERIELIHCNEHDHYPLVRQVARWAGVPVVTLVHWDLHPGFGLWAFRPPYQPACLEFVSRAVLEVSRPALPPELPPASTRVLMNGLDMSQFLARGDGGATLRAAWHAGPDTVVLGTASALRPRKRLEDFIRLIARLRGRGLKVRGILAGGGRFADPAYVADLVEIIRAERLQDDCLMVGNLDPLTPFLQAIDLFVSTSRWETFGMSLCEAMVCGKPVLAYDAGSVVEVVPDPAWVVPQGNLDALTTLAAELATDPVLRAERGRQAEQHVRAHFDGPVVAARQAAIYEEVLGRPLGDRTTARPGREGGVPA